MPLCQLGVLFGGASSEYEVSLRSAAAIIRNLDSSKYTVYPVGITKDGRMFLYRGSLSDMEEDRWQQGDCTPCTISLDRSRQGLLLLGEKPELRPLDCMFPVLHGKNGEDGTMQGLLQLAGIPFVGCGCLASAACMDKTVTHILLEQAGIHGARWLSTTRFDYRAEPNAFLERAERELGYPCFVKPANAGSSVGISKAADRKALSAAMELAFENDSKVLVEEMVSGREIECAVLGNDEPVASCLGEIVPCNDFYDYEAKYLDGGTKTYAPAPVEPAKTEEIRQIARRAFRAMGCTGFARVDFFLTADGKVLLNEINTIPGFTSISMYPKLFIESGLPFGELLDRLIGLAMETER